MVRKNLKQALLLTATVVVMVVAWNFRLVKYGLEQLAGQLTIVYSSVPLERALLDSTLTGDEIEKLKLVDEIREFAFDSIGLKRSGNYTTFYNQHGKPILWVVTACKRFALEPYVWTFPVIGSVSYKGFFAEEKALAVARSLKSSGYDASVSTVSGWSTLGWLKDPVLSGMLGQSEGELAETIIHELTHGTVFRKSSVEWNENLATFVGEQGADAFLSMRFGAGSAQRKAYQRELHDHALYSDHLLRGARRLDSLYRSWEPADLDLRSRARLKYKLIAEIMLQADTLSLADRWRYRFDFSRGKLPGNTFFMSALRYRRQQEDFFRSMETKFGNDLRKWVAHQAKLP